jgi:hypothetical protein
MGLPNRGRIKLILSVNLLNKAFTMRWKLTDPMPGTLKYVLEVEPCKQTNHQMRILLVGRFPILLHDSLLWVSCSRHNGLQSMWADFGVTFSCRLPRTHIPNFLSIRSPYPCTSHFVRNELIFHSHFRVRVIMCSKQVWILACSQIAVAHSSIVKTITAPLILTLAVFLMIYPVQRQPGWNCRFRNHELFQPW